MNNYNEYQNLLSQIELQSKAPIQREIVKLENEMTKVLAAVADESMNLNTGVKIFNELQYMHSERLQCANNYNSHAKSHSRCKIKCIQ